MIEQDLCLLKAVLTWATKAREEDGELVLERSPLHGLKPPREKNPLRVVLSEAEYQALLAVAGEVDWRFQTALVLANETGHRIGAIRNLRWSDFDLVRKVIRWRAEHEKTGFEHVTPMTDALLGVLEQLRKEHPGIGEALLLPSPEDALRPVSRHLVRDWWERAQKAAGLSRKRGRGWHSVRRKFASDLMDKPLKVLSRLGGWQSPQTLLACYQQPDVEQLREALTSRQVRRTGS